MEKSAIIEKSISNSLHFCINPEITLMINATITVLKTKEITLCIQAKRLILLELISTSET